MHNTMPHDRSPISQPEPHAVPATPAQAIRQVNVRDHRVASSELFVGTHEITIQHGDILYRLRLTAQDKLILTK